MFYFGHVLVVADRSLMLRHLLILFPHLSWVGFETWSPVLGPSDPPPWTAPAPLYYHSCPSVYGLAPWSHLLCPWAPCWSAELRSCWTGQKTKSKGNSSLKNELISEHQMWLFESVQGHFPPQAQLRLIRWGKNCHMYKFNFCSYDLIII